MCQLCSMMTWGSRVEYGSGLFGEVERNPLEPDPSRGAFLVLLARGTPRVDQRKMCQSAPRPTLGSYPSNQAAYCAGRYCRLRAR
jgi:hypothetical protein